jgi:hypothetical protein
MAPLNAGICEQVLIIPGAANGARPVQSLKLLLILLVEIDACRFTSMSAGNVTMRWMHCKR